MSMLSYENCLDIINQNFSDNMYNHVIKTKWSPIGGFSKNQSIVIFYTWKNKIIKAKEIIKKKSSEFLFEFRFYKNNLKIKNTLYCDYGLNIIDILNLTKYIKEEQPTIYPDKEYNFLEIGCSL